MIGCSEGIRGEDDWEISAQTESTSPAGNVVLSGASEAVRRRLIKRIEDDFFCVRPRRAKSVNLAILHAEGWPHAARRTPFFSDRFYAAQLQGKAVDRLHEGRNNAITALQ